MTNAGQTVGAMVAGALTSVAPPASSLLLAAHRRTNVSGLEFPKLLEMLPIHTLQIDRCRSLMHTQQRGMWSRSFCWRPTCGACGPISRYSGYGPRKSVEVVRALLRYFTGTTALFEAPP